MIVVDRDTDFVKLTTEGFHLYREGISLLEESIYLLSILPVDGLTNKDIYRIYGNLLLILFRQRVYDDLHYFKMRQEYYGPGGTSLQTPIRTMGVMNRSMLNNMPDISKDYLDDLYIQEVTKKQVEVEYFNTKEIQDVFDIDIYTKDGHIRNFASYDPAGISPPYHISIYGRNITNDYLEEDNLINTLPMYKENTYREPESNEANTIWYMSSSKSRIIRQNNQLRKAIEDIKQAMY